MIEPPQTIANRGFLVRVALFFCVVFWVGFSIGLAACVVARSLGDLPPIVLFSLAVGISAALLSRHL